MLTGAITELIGSVAWAKSCDIWLYCAVLGCGTLAVLEQNETGIVLLRR